MQKILKGKKNLNGRKLAKPIKVIKMAKFS